MDSYTDTSLYEAIFKRKSFHLFRGVGEDRLAQPWYVKNKDGILTVYRYRKPGKRGIMPAASVSYYNRIDMGIYLCILEVCMLENGIRFEREVFPDAGGEDEFTKVAVYRLNLTIRG